MKLLIFLVVLELTFADLPVHCVKHQIEGKWKFLIQKPQMKGMGPLSCGHDIPSKPQSSQFQDGEGFYEDSTLELDLSQTKWTMVYDEGFEVTHQSVSYFAFSKYQKNNDSATSYCDQTLIGWYTDHQSGNRGCYRAVKLDKVEATQSINQETVLQPEFLQKNQKVLTKEEHQDLVDKINNDPNIKWEAKVYDHLVGKSFAEINSMMGRKKGFQQKKKSSEKSFLQVDDDDKEYYKYYSVENVNDLPASFSWEKYLHKPYQQKQCGGCYAIASMNMLSTRLRIKGEDVQLSPQQSLNCNYYNQGCDGGYGFLVMRYGSENYLVTEEAEPYKGVDGKCKNYDKEGKVYKVDSYGYIGGESSKASEREIMVELMHNGPVVMNFEPTFALSYYKGGIYHSKEANDWIEGMENKPEWEQVDHSVLCYGWGEENGEKYWMIQNSWGEEWGENGNFRLRRGTDESDCESMSEAGVAVRAQRDNKVLTGM